MPDVINTCIMRRISCWLIFSVLTLSLVAQERIRFVSYNVENLFDCKDDSLTDDEAFLPTSLRRWTTYRYWQKLHDIGRVLATVGGNRAPDFVALCEVENDSVLHDLTHRSALRTVRYEYLMTSSLDPRGIDVALLYKPTTFRPFVHSSLRFPFEYIPQGSYVRDVLYVGGLLVTGDTLDIFVCHLPSRLNGRQAARLRLGVVEYMRHAIDSVVSHRVVPRVVLMGDLNDVADSEALRPLSYDGGMVCITDTLEGTYRYKGHWEQIDHIYLSPALLSTDNTPHLSTRGAWVVRDSSLTEPEPLYGGVRPFRTYNGMRYKGGVSDHLPVCFDLWFWW